MRMHRNNTPVFFLTLLVFVFLLLTLSTWHSLQVSYIFGVNITLSKIEDKHQTIHISSVVGGQNTARQSVTLFKSILSNTRNPIHFHLIVDSVSHPILEILFETWEIPGVTISFYHLEPYLSRISWIPNSHYSGNYGLSKLLLPEILPTVIEKVLLLDTDVVVNTDIIECWQFLDEMSGEQAIAMTENYSEWYTKRLRGPKWPALGRGFNSGVVLLNLNTLRNINFPMLWRRMAEKYLASVGSSFLADQDVLNAVAFENPRFFFKLPPEFNIQIGPQTDHVRVLKLSPKILHWNSKNKTSGTLEYMSIIRSQYEDMDAMAINVVRSSGSRIQEEVPEKDERDECDQFKLEKSYKAHVQLLPYKKDDFYNVTVVTQLSPDRLSMLVALINSWKGPVSAAIYGTDREMNQIVSFLKGNFPHRENLGIHGVHPKGRMYPINKLRNIAMDFVKTSFVLLLDVDFVVGDDSSLNDAVKTLKQNTVFVLPAFEFNSNHYDSNDIAMNKTQLIKMWSNGKVSQFREKIWAKGHRATDFKKWTNATQPFPVNWEANFEPYVLGRISEIPRFSERFGGFGWNKVSHSVQMKVEKIRFYVHPTAFVIHQAHPPSLELMRFRTNEVYRRCMLRFKRELIKELLSKTSI